MEIRIDKNDDIESTVKLNLHKYNQQNCEYIKNNSSFAHNYKQNINFGIFEDDKCYGGAVGQILFGWYNLSDFWIDEKVRKLGYGSKIIKCIEHIAKENNCLGVRIDTWNFQAPDFYKKLGYIVWGEFKDCPPGTVHYYLYKRF